MIIKAISGLPLYFKVKMKQIIALNDSCFLAKDFTIVGNPHIVIYVNYYVPKIMDHNHGFDTT